MNTDEIYSLVNEHSYIIVTPDGAGSKGDEAMICGCLSVLQGNRALLVTPNNRLWCDELLGRTHLFDECCVPLENMPQLFHKPQWLIMIGADTLDGSCGYEPAHWRLETLKSAVEHGAKAVVFCSVRSDMDQRLINEWKELPDSVQVFLRDSVSEENFAAQIGRPAQHFSDLSFFSEPTATVRTKAFCERIRQTAQGKRVIGLQMSETMFRSFHTVVTDEKRQEFAQQIASLAAEGIPLEDTMFLLLTHDTRSWPGHWSDYQYACEAGKYLAATKGFECLIQPPEFTQRELVKVLSLCDILICGRMHMSITAYCGGTVPLLVAGMGKGYVMVDKVRGMCLEWLGTDKNLINDLMQIPALRDKMLSTDSFENALARMRKSLPDRLRKERELMGTILEVHPVETPEHVAHEIALINAMSRSASLARNAEQLSNQKIQLENDLSNAVKECKKLHGIIQEQKAFLEHRTEEVRFRDEEIQKREEIIQDQRAFLAHRTDEVRFRDEEIQRKNEELRLKSEELQRQREELRCTQQHESILQAELDAIKNSRSWHLARGIAKLIRIFLPVKHNKD